ncbi:hypothetical protein ACPPVW_16025 [Leifsonia sp. McL0607]|uniref:hypothetical protein n=1 Tax=Leifsonia sp. McL0607 TaxID=3415672 RepID=UPI003CFA38B2
MFSDRENRPSPEQQPDTEQSRARHDQQQGGRDPAAAAKTARRALLRRAEGLHRCDAEHPPAADPRRQPGREHHDDRGR